MTEQDEAVRRLRPRLEALRDYGYQPMYNGRPSCPFCNNFVDDEETHTPGCLLVDALATPPPAAPALDVDAVRDALASHQAAMDDQRKKYHCGYETCKHDLYARLTGQQEAGDG